MESHQGDADELVGVSEIARRLGLTAQRVRQLAGTGQAPPPAGRIGRQSVWRWQDVAVWAAATGRLPAEIAQGRQAVRAWLPGRHVRRVLLIDAVEQWGDGAGEVHVRVWDAPEHPDEPPVVVLGNLDDYLGQTVTNRFEDVAMEVGARHLGPRALAAQFYDHWAAADGDAQFHHVAFTVQQGGPRSLWRPTARRTRDNAVRQLGALLTAPTWRPAPRREVESLTGTRLDVYLPGTYTSDLIRAVADSSDRRLGAVWDPGSSRATAAAALTLAAGSAEQAAARAAAARHALDEAERASRVVAVQAAGAPVWLVAPELPDVPRLTALADPGLLEDHDRLWQALAWVRGVQREIDPEARASLVPSVRPGWARLAWHEAGVAEPRDPRAGALGPIVLPEDLLGPSAPPRQWTPLEDLRHVEAAIVAVLGRACAAFDAWDVPATRPAGPFTTGTPTVMRYLAQLAWDEPGRRDPTRTHRLAARLGGAAGAREATDPDGNFVLRSADGARIAVEWPAVHRRPTAELAGAVVRADPARRTGALPVFLELPDMTLVPLPSEPSWRATHEYTWGHPGTGPDNLAGAVMAAADCAAGHPGGDFLARAADVVQRMVRSGEPPSWPLRDILMAAASARPAEP